jgi:methyl-accepting chemotaxis protein
VATVGNLVVNLKANTATFDKGVKGATARLKNFAKETFNFQNVLVAAAGAAGMGLAAKRIFDLGAAAEETASKFDTVFGPAANSVQQFVDNFGEMAGLSQTAAKEIVATTGAIVQGMGLAQAASAKYAEEVVRLAGDLTSFNDVPIEETARAIQSAITGERESLKRLGIVILETDVQKRALADTGKKLAKELTQEEKAMATLALITERAGVAIGDLERTQDSSANTARRLAARFQNMKELIATGLMPIFGELLTAIENLTGGFENSGAAALGFQGNVIRAVGVVQELGVEAAVAASALKLLFEANPATLLGRGLASLFTDIEGPLRSLKGAAEAFKLTTEAAREMRKEIREEVGRGLDDLNDILEQTEGNTEDLSDTVEDASKTIHELSSNLKRTEIELNENTVKTKEGGDALKEYAKATRETMSDVEDFARSMEQSLSTSISNVILRTQSLADAFKSMVDAIIRELIRLQVQKFFAETFTNIVGAAASGGGGNMEFGSAQGFRVFGGAQTSGNVISNVNFSINMIDASSGEDFIKQHGGTIAGVVSEAAQNSNAFAVTL